MERPSTPYASEREPLLEVEAEADEQPTPMFAKKADGKVKAKGAKAKGDKKPRAPKADKEPIRSLPKAEAKAKEPKGKAEAKAKAKEPKAKAAKQTKEHRAVNVVGTFMLTGNGAPERSLGDDGAVYLDLDANLLYGPKAGGVWPPGIKTFPGASTGAGAGAGAGAMPTSRGKESARVVEEVGEEESDGMEEEEEEDDGEDEMTEFREAALENKDPEVVEEKRRMLNLMDEWASREELNGTRAKRLNLKNSLDTILDEYYRLKELLGEEDSEDEGVVDDEAAEEEIEETEEREKARMLGQLQAWWAAGQVPKPKKRLTADSEYEVVVAAYDKAAAKLGVCDDLADVRTEAEEFARAQEAREARKKAHGRMLGQLQTWWCDKALKKLKKPTPAKAVTATSSYEAVLAVYEEACAILEVDAVHAALEKPAVVTTGRPPRTCKPVVNEYLQLVQAEEEEEAKKEQCKDMLKELRGWVASGLYSDTAAAGARPLRALTKALAKADWADIQCEYNRVRLVLGMVDAEELAQEAAEEAEEAEAEEEGEDCESDEEDEDDDDEDDDSDFVGSDAESVDGAEDESSAESDADADAKSNTEAETKTKPQAPVGGRKRLRKAISTAHESESESESEPDTESGTDTDTDTDTDADADSATDTDSETKQPATKAPAKQPSAKRPRTVIDSDGDF